LLSRREGTGGSLRPEHLIGPSDWSDPPIDWNLSAKRAVGTYTAPNIAPGGVQPSTAKGIYVFKVNGGTGGLGKPIQVFNLENPSWVAVDAGHQYARPAWCEQY
jgi:hypothetical protein